MALSRDPETLKIPAFLRRASLARSKRSKALTLPITALERKEKAKAKKSEVHVKSKKLMRPKALKNPVEKPALRSHAKIARKRALEESQKNAQKYRIKNPETTSPQRIGTLTHYYSKIRVGVIALTETLTIGDAITYPTENGAMRQEVVTSMEINRAPVFKAEAGSEVGLRLSRPPKLTSAVWK